MRWLFSLFLLLPTFDVEGSSIRRLSDDFQADAYQAIFSGEVTGIHLTNYETQLLGNEKDQLILGLDEIGNFALNVVVDEVFDGEIDPAIQVDIAGTFRVPKLGETGLFLLPKNSKFSQVIWSDDVRYARFMARARSIRPPGNYSPRPTP
ncbi:MAG: hypothetical protein ABIR27_10855 [Dokdonella sp.]